MRCEINMQLDLRVGCSCNACSQRRSSLPARSLFTNALWVCGEDDVISASAGTCCRAVTSLGGSRDRERDSVLLLPSISVTKNEVIVWRCCFSFASVIAADKSHAIGHNAHTKRRAKKLIRLSKRQHCRLPVGVIRRRSAWFQFKSSRLLNAA